MMYEPCWGCDASGYTTEDEVCMFCDGAGDIETDDLKDGE